MSDAFGESTSANTIQLGGDHYRDGGAYQHWDLVSKLKLNYFVGNATKYLTRWRKKNGLQDLEKAAHYVMKLRELWCESQSNGTLMFSNMVEMEGEEIQQELLDFYCSNKVGKIDRVAINKCVKLNSTGHGEDFDDAYSFIHEMINMVKAGQKG